MTRSWGVVVTFVLCWCLFASLASGPATPGAASGDTATATSAIQTAPSQHHQTITDGVSIASLGSVEIDRTLFSFTVASNGDAQWVFEFRLQLENNDEVRNFEEFATAFRSNETDLYTDFRDRALGLVESANRTTNREMRAQSFGRDALVEKQLAGDVGVLRIRFGWTNFARVTQNGVVRVGDVFSGQLFIDENQSLRLVAGEGLQFESVDPAPPVKDREPLAASTRLTWEGQREFADGRPRAVLVPTDYDGPIDPGSNAENNAGGPSILALGGLFVLALTATTVVLWRRDRLPLGETLSGTLGDGTEQPTSAESASTGPSPTPRAETAETTESPDEPAIPDEELLSDEDRVRTLLEDQGGRMKQVDIVDETGWSKSKVSMLLSDMDEDGEITKIRVGRENIIALEGEEPDAAGSPFEDA